MVAPVGSAPLVLRRLLSSDVSAAHQLSKMVGWPHREEDWRFAHRFGIGFVAEDQGKVIGTALCWKFGIDKATLGMVIVSPEAQGRGIGRQLMTRVLDELEGRVTVLYATQAGQPLYEKLGFQACGTLAQHHGVIADVAPVVPPVGEVLEYATARDVDRIVALASLASELDRGVLLPALIETSDVVVLRDRHSSIKGFAMVRDFGRGKIIGPVVADGSQNGLRAKSLIAHGLSRHPGEFVRIDVPGGAGLDDWLVASGLSVASRVIKMVRNVRGDRDNQPQSSIYRSYGIITQAMA